MSVKTETILGRTSNETIAFKILPPYMRQITNVIDPEARLENFVWKQSDIGMRMFSSFGATSRSTRAEVEASIDGKIELQPRPANGFVTLFDKNDKMILVARFGHGGREIERWVYHYDPSGKRVKAENLRDGELLSYVDDAGYHDVEQ